MFFDSKKNIRVETMEALTEEDTKEAIEEDMDEEEDMVVVEAYHLPTLIVVK